MVGARNFPGDLSPQSMNLQKEEKSPWSLPFWKVSPRLFHEMTVLLKKPRHLVSQAACIANTNFTSAEEDKCWRQSIARSETQIRT